MYRLLIFLAVSLTVSAEDKMDFEKCLTVLKTHTHCCKESLYNKTTIIDDDVKECKLMPRIPGSCDRALCFGNKLGFATADGTINMEKLQKHTETKLSDHKDIVEAVKTNCFDGRYKLFGEPDECDLMKIEKCVHWQYIFRCPDFSKEESCKGFQNTAAKCLELDS